jgi:pimeloyl-ACP methyl ester carboxylesterase
MRSTVKVAALAAAVATLGLLGLAGNAAAAGVVFTPCAGASTLGCAHLSVPLDPSGATPGTVSLAIRRQLSVTGSATEAVIALAGGPGQRALPFTGQFAQVMAPALKTRDLVVFDQRGTGYSGALKCSSLSSPTATLASALPACANAIGATRGLYTTDQSVADIEAIRVALGYSKLVLYGTSYGTKVALRYAARYPQNVAGLVLDSTVSANGPDIFGESSLQAVPRVLASICAGNACASTTRDAGSDLTRLLARIGNGTISGTYYSSAGHRARVSLGAAEIAEVLVAGDEDPTLRADFPAAVASALQGDYAPLAVLYERANGTSGSSGGIDEALYLATECEELPFPWVRSDMPAARLAEATAAASALPAGSFGPFSASAAINLSLVPDCVYWPNADASAEAAVTALPNVPTLIISGADDLRTPTEDARKVASMIPDAQVLVVPQTGHSVISSEPTSCALNAVKAFFAGTPIVACTAAKLPSYLQPAPLAPKSTTQLRALTAKGLPGRTFTAVDLTIVYVARALNELIYEAGATSVASVRGVGGLHGGWLHLTSSGVTFHHYSYVPGVTITGTLTAKQTRLVIAGSDAARGLLTATRTKPLAGKLGGANVGTKAKATTRLALHGLLSLATRAASAL